MLIFLIGLPGSGKTTLGKQLAKKLPGYIFSDLDEKIVKTNQLSIEEIFAQQGEAAFRIMERDCLHSYSPDSNTIISTGGGAPCFHDNMSWINAHGISIFLNPPLEELAKRLHAANNTHRPMLKGLSHKEILHFLQGKLNDRLFYYSQSTHDIKKENPSVKDLLEKINET